MKQVLFQTIFSSNKHPNLYNIHGNKQSDKIQQIITCLNTEKRYKHGRMIKYSLGTKNRIIDFEGLYL